MDEIKANAENQEVQVNEQVTQEAIETMKKLTFESGDTYSYKEEIYNYMLKDI